MARSPLHGRRIHIAGSVVEDVAVATGDDVGLARELVVRDEQIVELQQAVMELADMRGSAPADNAPLADLLARVAVLETRTTDHNDAIRHVLTMLIEWLEAENASARAA